MNKWDYRYLKLAEHISMWSRDPSTRCGAVIVRNDKTVASIGYNGFPKVLLDTDTLYADRDIKYSRTVHAEVNALIHARCSVEGFTLYTFPFGCCDRCSVQMLQAGISRFVFPELIGDQETRWADSIRKTKEYILEAGKEFTQVTWERLHEN